MSKLLITFFFAIGSSTWVYTQLQKRSGNNTKQSLIATSIFGVIVFVALLALLSL